MSTLEYAKSLDNQDSLSSIREQFHIPEKDGKNFIYLCGHSLGLQPKMTSNFINQELADWKKFGCFRTF